MTLEGNFKDKKISLQSQKKWDVFLVFNVKLFGDLGLENWQLGLKVFVPTSKMSIRRQTVQKF